MGVKRWLLHNIRSALGTAQTLNKVEELKDLVIQLADPTVPTPKDAVRVLVNGDPITLPEDLLKYIIHTRVSDQTDPLPKFLAETEQYMWCRSRLNPGDHAMDIGSNIGLFSIMMGNRVKYGKTGIVYAFEASLRSYHDLCRVVQLNQLGIHASVHHAAVADKPGVLKFVDFQTETVSRESSHLATLGYENQADRKLIDVTAISLDSFAEQHPGQIRPRLIKIDVEGAEFMVLDGARKLIADVHPYLCIEFHPDNSGVCDHARLQTYLNEFGYKFTHRDKTYFCE